MLELTSVTRRFGATAAVEELSLTVPAGRSVVLLGPSGCGKSTVLRLLAGLLEPDSGVVAVDGEVLTAANVLEVRRRLGYVIQEGGLFPHLRAAENAALLARHLGWSRERIDARIRELAELTHLPLDALQRYPAQLSGGQRQRVALVRALMLDPKALLLDEPLGALDPLIRSELQQELRDLFQALGKTVVLVTHDLAEAAWFADEIVLMREARIVQRGTFADLDRRPADEFVRRFVKAQRHLHGGMGT